MRLMKIIPVVFVFMAIQLESSPGHARVFDFKNEHFATYFGGSYGPSAVGDTQFNGSSGNNVIYDQVEQSNLSFDFGFVLVTQVFNIRAGAEYLFPRHLSNVTGFDTSNNNLYNLDTNIAMLIPMGAIEVPLLTRGTFKWLASVGGGWGYMNGQNQYTFTAKGNTTFGLSDFTEYVTAQAPMVFASTAAEFLMTDTVTMNLELGYRQLKYGSLTYSQAGKNFEGTVNVGDTATNMNGLGRSLDMSGVFLGIILRFYL